MDRVQRVLRDKQATRDAKLEVLLMQWDRVLNMVIEQREAEKKSNSKKGGDTQQHDAGGKLDNFLR